MFSHLNAKLYIPRAAVLALGMVAAVSGCAETSLPPLPDDLRQDQAVLEVAVLTPMTGELSTFGEPVRNGIRLAFEEWNQAGGIQGQMVQIVLADTACDPYLARQAAEQVVEDGVKFIVGGVCSEAALAIADVAEKHEVLFVAVAATHPGVTLDSAGATRSFVFRTAYAYPQQGRAAANYALQTLGYDRAAVLMEPSDSWERRIGQEFTEAFLMEGGQVITLTAHSEANNGLAELLNEVEGAGIDLLYLPGDFQEANDLGNQLGGRDRRVVLMGTETWDDPRLDLAVLSGSYFTVQYSPSAPNQQAQEWAEAYLAAYALQADALAALGYDAANLLASALQEAGSVSAPDAARAMEISEYNGVTGRWRFDSQHNPLKDVVVLGVEDGQTHWVGTSPMQ